MRYGSFAHVPQEGLQQYRTLSQPSGITLSPKCSAEDYFQHHSRRCSSSSNCKRLRSLRQRIVRDYIHMFFLLSPPTRYFHRNHVHPPQSLEGKPFSFLYCTYHSTGLSHQKSRSRSTPSMEEHWSIAWKNWINKLWLHAARDAEGQESQNKEKTLFNITLRRHVAVALFATLYLWQCYQISNVKEVTSLKCWGFDWECEIWNLNLMKLALVVGAVLVDVERIEK